MHASRRAAAMRVAQACDGAARQPARGRDASQSASVVPRAARPSTRAGRAQRGERVGRASSALRAGLLRELLAVGARAPAACAGSAASAGRAARCSRIWRARVVGQVFAAHDVGDALRRVVDDDRELVGPEAVGAPQHEVADLARDVLALRRRAGGRARRSRAAPSAPARARSHAQRAPSARRLAVAGRARQVPG